MSPLIIFLLLTTVSSSILIDAGSAKAADHRRVIAALTALRTADKIAQCELQRQAQKLDELQAVNNRLIQRRSLVSKSPRRLQPVPADSVSHSGEFDVLIACGPEAARQATGCPDIRRSYGLQLDREAAALCDSYELCMRCGETIGLRGSDACDRAYAHLAAKECLQQAESKSCGRQADLLLAIMRHHYRHRQQSRPGTGCSRACAYKLFKPVGRN